ncbi:MAG: biotin transporter BioY [Acidimicrobiia bacterium]|nr:biotin transporter BioY [Acidimicrobiia bacterium]
MLTLAPKVLAARVAPRTKTSAVVLTIAFAALTALAAQWRFYLPFTPIPITGQTFAVLLSGAALGWRLGGASQVLYVGAGLVGLPVFAGGGSGFDTITGASGGYLVGFVIAAALVGHLAERGQDRRVDTAAAAFLLGSVVIYLFGVAWLMQVTGWDLPEAMAKGVAPFVVGDLLKAGFAALALPAVWRLVGDRG